MLKLILQIREALNRLSSKATKNDILAELFKANPPKKVGMSKNSALIRSHLLSSYQSSSATASPLVNIVIYDIFSNVVDQ